MVSACLLPRVGEEMKKDKGVACEGREGSQSVIFFHCVLHMASAKHQLYSTDHLIDLWKHLRTVLKLSPSQESVLEITYYCKNALIFLIPEGGVIVRISNIFHIPTYSISNIFQRKPLRFSASAPSGLYTQTLPSVEHLH